MAHGAADPEGNRGRAHGAAGPEGAAARAQGGGSGGAAGADGGGEESQLVIGGDEQRHPCDGKVRDREEPPLPKKSRKEQKRKKPEKRKRVEEDSRPRETAKTNKRGCSPSATLRSLYERVDIKLESSTITPDQLMNIFQKNYDLLLAIFNPEGWLEITYVDESLRIGRDDKANIRFYSHVGTTSDPELIRTSSRQRFYSHQRQNAVTASCSTLLKTHYIYVDTLA